ncbi:MAG: N-carbamoyl-L-amino acid amidohydrolase [Mariprofundaceae bacterium]
MFVKIDKKTLQEVVINSEEMVIVLEADLKPQVVDEALTDMVCGRYEHGNALATYKYKTS